METLAVEGFSSLTILAVALAIWFLSSKATRKSVGTSVQEGAQTIEQSLYVARLASYKEARDELGDLIALGKEANQFLSDKNGSK